MVLQRGNAAFAEESAEVQVLLASLSKTQDLTKRIASSLSRLDASGKIVKDAIGPIYNNTQQLQVTSRNIDKVNDAIERIRKPLDAKGREEGIIQAGPKASGLPQYLGALKRIDKALSELTSTNLRANQQAIADFHGLLTTGVDQLRDLYRQSLTEDDQPIEPLHYITKGLPFPVYSSEKTQSLYDIASALVAASAQSARLGKRDDDPAERIYAEVRGEYLQHSLQNLATASISTSKRGPNDTSVYRLGSNAITTYSQGIENMFLAEFENISRVFRGDTIAKVFNDTCATSLKSFSKTLNELNGVIKSRILTDCFLAYEIIDLITPVSYRLEKRTGQLRSQISDALRPIRDTARSSLSELLARTKSQAESISTLPPDGATIPLVYETAARLKALGQFDKPLLHLLTSIGDGGWRKDAGSSLPSLSTSTSSTLNLTDGSSDKSVLLSHYLADLLEVLMTTLSSRAQILHRSKPIQGIFLLNTVAVLARVMHSSQELQPYLSPTRLDPQRKNGTSLYMSAWREPSAHLLDTINTGSVGSSGGSSNRPVSGGALESTAIIKSLSSKDKDKIKEKFKLFTTSFDEQVARHKSMHMEKEVKSALQRDIQAMIEPLYGRFWDRYHEVDKGKGKTVKYSKAELVQLLTSL